MKNKNAAKSLQKMEAAVNELFAWSVSKHLQ